MKSEHTSHSHRQYETRLINRHRQHARLPETAEEAASLNVLDDARRAVLDFRSNVSDRNGFTDNEVLIAGLLALHRRERKRADSLASRLAQLFALYIA